MRLPVLAVARIGRPVAAAAAFAGALAAIGVRMPGILPCRLHRRGAAIGAPVGGRDGDPDQPLDVAQERRLIARAERDGDAIGPGARGAADAMHIAFRDIGQVVVDDVAMPSTSMPRAAISVATRMRTLALAEGGEHALALRSAILLPWMASAAMPLLLERAHNLSAPCLVRVKTSARLTFGRRAGCRTAAPGLAPASRWMTRWSMRSTVVASGVTCDLLPGSFSICAASSAISFGMVAENISVCRLGELRDDLPDVVDEAHVEHAVGFVEHQHFDAVQAQGVLLHEIEQAAGGGDQDIDDRSSGRGPGGPWHAADGKRGLQPQMAAIGAEAGQDLAGQFTRRAQHQHAAGLAFNAKRVRRQPIEDRERESGGLAGAGLRDADDIAAGHDERDGLGLDRGGGYVLLFGEGTANGFGKAEFSKSGQRTNFL